MGAKKKSEGSSSSSKNAQPDDSGEKLYRALRRSLYEYGVTMPKKLEEKFLTVRDEKNPETLREVSFLEPVGILVVRALADALRDTQYLHLQSMQFVNAEVEDEGVRSIMQFITVSPTVSVLEFLECGLTSLSCEFLMNTLLSNRENPLSVLKLDHNNISDQGVEYLSRALRMNTFIRVLSLSYCGINTDSARLLMEVLIFQESVLEELELKGNFFMHQGALQLFFGLKINQALAYLGLADNAITCEEDSTDFYSSLVDMLKVNSSISKIDLRYNRIPEKVIKGFCNQFKNIGNKSLGELLLTESAYNEAVIEELKNLVSAGGGKKGKKGKKKGKKGKKK